MTNREAAPSGAVLFTRSGRQASQQPSELAAFINLLNENNVSSYLEIGAKHGDTFFEIMKALPKGARGVAVDLPDGPWCGAQSRRNLESCIEELKSDYDVDCLFGDSREIELDEYFDAIFIDADHRYESVRKDFDIYRKKGKMIAFHDIGADGVHCGKFKVEVKRLWDEIKGDFRSVELIIPDDNRPMGIGVLFV